MLTLRRGRRLPRIGIAAPTKHHKTPHPGKNWVPTSTFLPIRRKPAPPRPERSAEPGPRNSGCLRIFRWSPDRLVPSGGVSRPRPGQARLRCSRHRRPYKTPQNTTSGKKMRPDLHIPPRSGKNYATPAAATRSAGDQRLRAPAKYRLVPGSPGGVRGWCGWPGHRNKSQQIATFRNIGKQQRHGWNASALTAHRQSADKALGHADRGGCRATC